MVDTSLNYLKKTYKTTSLLFPDVKQHIVYKRTH